MKGRDIAVEAIEAAFGKHIIGNRADDIETMVAISAAVRAAARTVPASATIPEGAVILIDAGFAVLVKP